jgi:RNA polymerase sigma-70 factor (ECF subfamily)
MRREKDHQGFLSKLEAKNRVVALYETHRDHLYRFLLLLGLKPELGRGVTQDVFVDLYVALEKGTDVKSEQAWLYTVAADYGRRDGRSSWVELDSDARMAAGVGSGEANPEARVGALRGATALRRLSKKQQLCLHLRAQGLCYREIAKILEVSTSMVAECLASAIDRPSGEDHE